MSGLRPRRALIAAAILVAGLATARSLSLARAEATLEDRGLHWASRDAGLLEASWREIEGPGLRADAVHAHLLPTLGVEIEAPEVDLSALDLPSPGEGGASGELLGGLPLAVEVHGLTLRWGGTTLASDLSGPLLPAMDLQGDGAQLSREGERWVGSLTRALDLGPASGELTLRFSAKEDIDLEISVPELRASWDALAPAPLGPIPLAGRAKLRRDGAFEAEGELGALPWRARGVLGLEPRQLDLALSLGPASLSAVAALFGDQVPEAKAELQGTLGLELDVHGPPWRWRAVPSADGLQAEGAAPPLDALRGGTFTWRAPGPDGEPLVRGTGEGSPGWVPLRQAGKMPAAVVAAEDAAFWRHPGYDLDAIQEALDAWAAGEERPRGGSTLTQQLAKNLFFDGDRTLLRKLRELTVAVELERRLGKQRILELYLNVVELGPETYGIGPASQLYFLKSPEGLTWKEAAFLAAILPAPRTYYQTGLLEGRPPNARVERVLENLVRLGAMSPAEATRARAEPLRLIPPL